MTPDKAVLKLQFPRDNDQKSTLKQEVGVVNL
jgi:hypothetical protein